MKRYRVLLLSVSVIVLLLVQSGCSEVSGTRTVKLAHGLDVSHPVHKAMVRMAELVDEQSGGELQIDIYPSQQYWLRGLTYYDAGQRSFYTQGRPIRTPEDLAGLKIRVQESAMAVNMVRTLGGSPTPISWGELYTALQQGIVDGAENNLPSYHSSRHYEVSSYFSLDEHSAIPDILLPGTRFWESLSPQQQQWIQQAADSSKTYQRQLWAEAEKEGLKVIKEAGIEVIRPDKEPFREKVAVIYDRFEQNEPEFYKLIQRIRKVK
ncbi:MAG TPA: TRAP transporter substrate-binding protein DctP [Fodinibius sp.]|nr:TRAP transporter substrate-binding protein DctP [Fodinibius sp.]